MLQQYCYILIPSKNTTYIHQQIDNILEFWQHVSAVKSHSSGQNRTMSRYNKSVYYKSLRAAGWRRKHYFTCA